MSMLLTAVHCVAGAIVLAEALNKLERAAPLQPGLCPRGRLVVVIKAAGWSLLAIGAGGALVTPLLNLPGPSLGDAATMTGFALLVVRSRLREGVRPAAEQSA